MFSSFRLLEERPERGLSSMLKPPFLKRENLSNTRARLRACSLKAFWSISNDFVGVFLRRKQISNKFFVPLNHTSRFRQGHKNYLHENWPCGRLSCYNVRLATDSWVSREQALTLSFSHSSPFDGIENSLVFWVPPRISNSSAPWSTMRGPRGGPQATAVWGGYRG